MIDEREIRNLIQQGRQAGFLTYDEIFEHLPLTNMSIDEMDNFFITLSDMGISIIEKHPEQLPVLEKQPVVLEDEEAIRLKMDDPVRMYLTEMGKSSLLQRKEELELTKSIWEKKERTQIDSFGFPDYSQGNKKLG